jgi:hypothetical protein
MANTLVPIDPPDESWIHKAEALGRKLLRQAKGLSKSVWKYSSKLARKWPIGFAILEGYQLLTSEEAQKVFEEIKSATGQDFKSINDMMNAIQKDVNIENVAADYINRRMPSREQMADLIPEALRKFVDPKRLAVLRARWDARRHTLDNIATIHTAKTPDELELRMATIKAVSQIFGVSDPSNLRSIHSTLRAFVNTDSASISNTLNQMENY